MSSLDEFQWLIGDLTMPVLLSFIQYKDWFNVHHNEFTGSIPANMSLGKRKIFDISNNRIGSTIPPNFVDEIVPNVRHLHIENNLLNGTVPENFVNLGKGRVLQIYMNDNQFSGAFPTRFEEVKHLSEFSVCDAAYWIEIPNSYN